MHTAAKPKTEGSSMKFLCSKLEPEKSINSKPDATP